MLSIRAHRARFVEHELHENQIEPTSELASDFGHARDLGKAGSCVQCKRGFIAGVDAGEEDVLAERGCGPDEFVDEDPADVAPALLGMDVDAVLDTIAIGWPSSEIAERAVAENGRMSSATSTG